jgi:hypothetical protein
MNISFNKGEHIHLTRTLDEADSVHVYNDEKCVQVWIDPSKVKVYDKETCKQYILILLTE